MSAAAKVPPAGWPEQQKCILAALKSRSPKQGVERSGSFLALCGGICSRQLPWLWWPQASLACGQPSPTCLHIGPPVPTVCLCPRFSLHKDTSSIGLGNDLNLNWFSTKTLLDMRLPSQVRGWGGEGLGLQYLLRRRDINSIHNTSRCEMKMHFFLIG